MSASLVRAAVLGPATILRATSIRTTFFVTRTALRPAATGTVSFCTTQRAAGAHKEETFEEFTSRCAFS